MLVGLQELNLKQRDREEQHKVEESNSIIIKIKIIPWFSWSNKILIQVQILQRRIRTTMDLAHPTNNQQEVEINRMQIMIQTFQIHIEMSSLMNQPNYFNTKEQL